MGVWKIDSPGESLPARVAFLLHHGILIVGP